MRGSASERATLCPSYSVMMSPALIPAFMAGEPSATFATSAPVVSLRPKPLASSGVSDWMETPSQLRDT